MAAYPAVLQERLTRRYSLQRITVENAGVPKEQAADAVSRFRNALRASRPDVVLLLQGYNDLGSPSARRAASSALDDMAKETRGAGARLFLATLTPSVPGRDRAPDPSSVLAMNDAIRSLAAGERAALVDLYAAALPNLRPGSASTACIRPKPATPVSLTRFSPRSPPTSKRAECRWGRPHGWRCSSPRSP